MTVNFLIESNKNSAILLVLIVSYKLYKIPVILNK